MTQHLLFRLIFLASLIAQKTICAQTVKIVDVFANDLVYDANTDRIYVSVSSVNGSNGNSIGVINPHTATLDTTVFIGSEPDKLAISDNGQFVFASLFGSGSVRRFNVPMLKSESQFSLGSDPFTGQFFAEDIEVMPGQANTLAVSRRNFGFSPKHEGVAIYDNGVQRPKTTVKFDINNVIEFLDAGTVYGLNNETTEFGLRKLAVDAQGIQEISLAGSVTLGFFNDFIISKKVLYLTNGRAYDVSGSGPVLLATFPFAYGNVAADTLANRIAYLADDFNTGQLLIRRYNPDNFLSADTIELDNFDGTPIQFICWGKNRYAFNTVEGQVVIIGDMASGTQSPGAEAPSFLLYPNPVSDFFNVEIMSGPASLIQIRGFDGRLVRQFKPASGTAKTSVDASGWPKGLYQVCVFYENGSVSARVLVRQ